MLSSDLSMATRAVAQGVAANPLLWFEPSPALAPVMDDDSRRIFVRAANRAGKSKHLAKKLAQAMVERPGLRCRAIAVNYKQATKVVSKYLYEFLPKEAVADDCHFTETRGWTHGLIRLKNGSSCQIMSSDQQPIAHAGDSLDIVWIDEVPPPAILDENIARVMDVQGAVWLSATPIGRPVQWLKDLVEDPYSPWVEYVVEFSHENCPWYSKEQCEAWIEEAKAAPWSYNQRILGDWEGISLDRIFTGFDEGSILPKAPDEHFHAGIGLDHGELSGHEAAVLFIWNDAIAVALDEYVSEGRSSVEEDARGVLAMLARHGLDLTHISRIVGDVNSAGKAAQRKGAGHTVNELFVDAFETLTGYTVTITTPSKGPGSVDAGNWIINHAFMQRRLYTTDNTPHLNHELRHYNGKGGGHITDALRYIGAPIVDIGNTGDSPGYLYRKGAL